MKKAIMGKIKPNIRNALKKLGFTDYYINIYVTLLDSGECNAHDLSKKTGVPYSRIYEVLNEMTNNQKLLTKIDGRPSTFIANNPSDVFKSLKLQRDQHFDDNMEISLPFLKDLFGDHNVAKQISLTVFEGGKSCQDHVRGILNFTVKKLDFCVKNIDDIFFAIQINFDYLKRIGCKMRVILEERFEESEYHKNLLKYCKVKLIPNIQQTLLISDDKTSFMAIKSNFNIVKPSELDYSIISSSESLFVTFISEIFERLWEISR